MPKLTNEAIDELYADAEGQELVEAIHDRKRKAEDDADLAARGIDRPAETLVLKEFKSTILPKAAGTRKVPTWHTDDEARDYWVQRVSEYPVMTQVTPRHKLRLSYVFGGRMTVAGEVVIDLAAAAQIKIEGLGE